jgi:hypothetical protein
VHEPAVFEPLSQRAQPAVRVGQVVQHANAVDEVILAIQVGNIVERHVVEVGIVRVPHKVGALGALFCDFEGL